MANAIALTLHLPPDRQTLPVKAISVPNGSVMNLKKVILTKSP